MRKERLLGGKWSFYKGCADIESLKSIKPIEVSIPHTWNNIDGQDGGNDYYRGICCYRKVFTRPAFEACQQLYLEFGAVNSSADVYFNRQHVKTHHGGYSAFQIRIDQLLEDENELIVFADNSFNDAVYQQTADFTFYGGIYREVKLVCVESTHFEFGKHGGKGLKVSPSVLANGNGKLEVSSWISGQFSSYAE